MPRGTRSSDKQCAAESRRHTSVETVCAPTQPRDTQLLPALPRPAYVMIVCLISTALAAFATHSHRFVTLSPAFITLVWL